MAGGGLVVGNDVTHYPARLTPFVIIACIVAASGGLIFGYDLGISGGVTGMDSFVQKFFPSVYASKKKATEDNYCKFDNHVLQFFTSSLYLAALVASLVASVISRKYGRIASIRIGGLFFLAGAILNGAAINMTMLIVGRILLGFGVGFGNQSVPVYLSEMAPTGMRGALNMMFQIAITIGILSASVINYGASKIVPWGWRLSLGLASVPAILMTIGGFTLPDTPNSLIERGHLAEGKHLLLKIRGVPNVDSEYDELVSASLKSNLVEQPLRSILELRNRPQLIMAICIPFFQQLTGINAIMFYAPVLFQTLGFGNNASLYVAVITGAVNLVATFVSVVTVDKFGRRKLFLQGGFQMIISQVIIGIILKALFGSVGQLSTGPAISVVIMICAYVAAFAWSWGPLGWLVPSEIFPLETRSAGQAINVSTNMLFTFVVAQVFLSMLCHFQYGIFFFFAGWVCIMSIFVYFFLPETKGVPIEEMSKVWRAHWFWGRFVEATGDIEEL